MPTEPEIIKKAAGVVKRKMKIVDNDAQKTTTKEKCGVVVVVEKNLEEEEEDTGKVNASVDETARTKKVRTVRTSADYETMSHREHVLRVPDTYIGSIVPVKMTKHIYDVDSNHMKLNQEVTSCEGIERLFLEILSNAADNIITSRHFEGGEHHRQQQTSSSSSSSNNKLNVHIDEKNVTIRNGGAPIPITPHASSTFDKLVLIPNIIFGQLLSSSNYDSSVARVGAGRNGYGAKLTNIFSTNFQVKIGDPTNGQEYTCIWSKNMSEVIKNDASPGYEWSKENNEWVSRVDKDAIKGKRKPYKGVAYVEVSYDVDFSRFEGITFYTPELIGTFARYVLDYSFTSKIPIHFNGKVLDARLPKSFVKYYFPDQADKIVVHYEWASKKDVDLVAKSVTSTSKDAISKALISGNLNVTPVTEMIVIDTPDSACYLGFVNGLCVPDGAHVYEAMTKVCAAIVASSPAATAASKTGLSTLSSSDVRPHVSIVVNCHLQDPRFTSQTKQVLSEPRPRINISPDAFKSALTSSSDAVRWTVGTRLAEVVDMKNRRAATKTDGGKKRRVVVEGAVHANLAGTSRGGECTLWLTEGDSAAAYTEKRVFMLEGRQDLHGIYGCRGKFINVKSASQKMLFNNPEYIDIKKLVGLSEGADYNATPESAKCLRYGKIVIAADADEDGSSIRALLINCFACRWPSLIRAGRIAYLATPAIRITHPKTGEVIERFYTDSAYYEWERKNPGKSKGLRIRHLKGLASSTDKDIQDDLMTAPTIHIIYDDTAVESLDLAFSSKRADDRKRWIESWRQSGVTSGIDDIVFEPLSKTLSSSSSSLVTTATSSKTLGKTRQHGATTASSASSFSSSLNLPVARRTVSDIINKDLAEYSLGSLFRAIPSCDDGLKRSQRQAIWHCLNYWNFGVGEGSNKDSLKVSRLASAVAEATSYAHGETSMQGALVGLAQNFIGSNNLSVLFPDGQFGSRAGGTKKHGAPRYIYTKTDWCVPYLFSKEAVSLVQRRMVEGEKVETTWIPCDIPLFSVVNGARGIATGWSCFIPCHSVLETVEWILNRLYNQETKEPSIWYDGFTGQIEIVERKSSTGKESNDIIDEDDDTDEEHEVKEDADKLPKKVLRKSAATLCDAIPSDSSSASNFRSMVSHGRFSIMRHPSQSDPTYDIVIDEIPIGTWSKEYMEWLEKLAEAGCIGDVANTSKNAEKPSFVLKKVSSQGIIEYSSSSVGKKKASVTHPAVSSTTTTAAVGTTTSSSKSASLSFPPPPITEKLLKLVKSQALNNMILIDEFGVPKRYRSVNDIMEAHFVKMLNHYVEIKKLRINTIEELLKTLVEKHALLEAIVTNNLVVFRRPEDEIITDIKKMKLSEDEYHKLKLKECTSEKVEDLVKKIDETYKHLEETKKKPHKEIWAERLHEFKKTYATWQNEKSKGFPSSTTTTAEESKINFFAKKRAIRT